MPFKLRSLLVYLVLPYSIFFATTVSAQTYYVDATGGSDKGTGLSVDTAWQTIAKVNASVFVPGDSILFKCGEAWRESLVVSPKGVKGNPVTYGTYGSCNASNKPIINAADVVSGWTQYSGNIYAADVTFPVQQDIVDGTLVDLAHYPNRGYNSQKPTNLFLNIPADSVDGNGTTKYNYLVDDRLAGMDLIGAIAMIRTITWVMEDCPITGINGMNQISWGKCTTANNASGTHYPILKDWAYYLTNKLWMLDQPGEWYYDTPTQKLYLWMPGSDSPASHTVEASRYDAAVNASSPGSVAIDGFNIKNAGKWGVRLVMPIEMSLRNLEVTNSGGTGILIAGDGSYGTVSNAVRLIDNNVVRKSVLEGITVEHFNDAVITNNLIEDSGTVGTPQNTVAAIRIQQSSNVNASYNIIRRSGYLGIGFFKNNIIQNNVVDDTCMVLDDCGAIYTWNGPSEDYFNPDGSVKKAVALVGGRVTGNIVRNVNPLLNVDGNKYQKTSSEGIYLDELANGVEVSGNTVINADRAMHMNNPFNHNIHDNTFFAAKDVLIDMTEGFPPIAAGTVQGNVLQNNIFFPLNTLPSINLQSVFNSTNLFGSFIANIYSGILSVDLAIESAISSWPYQINTYDLPKWQQNRSRDLNGSVYAPFTINPFKILTDTVTNIIPNGTFDTAVTPWLYWPTDVVISQQKNCSTSGGCMKIQPGTQSSSSAISKTFALTQGKTYLLEFSASSTQDNQNFDVTVRLNSGPNWDVLGLNQVVAADPKWKKYAMTFIATQTTPNARLDLMIRKRTGIDESILVDNVSLREITASYNNPNDAAKILVNDTAAQASMACPDSRCNEYVDLNNNAVSWPVSLSGFSSKIIVWKNNPFKDLTPPTVPAGLRVAGVSSSQVNLAWTASTDEKLTVSGYYIYRNGTQIGTTAGVSYIDTGLSPSSAYIYSVAAYNTAGNISARSGDVTATTSTTPVVVVIPPPPVVVPAVIENPLPIATTTVPTLVATTTPPIVATTTPSSIVSAPQRPQLFTKNLFLDMQDDEVRKLQELLSKDVLVYPEARITGYYGPATKAAVGRFQEKYQLGTPATSGYGGVGPKTREKLEELFNSEIAAEVVTTITKGTIFQSNLRVGSRGNEVEALQRYLAQDSKLYPEGLITGYYGRATKAAVGRLQEKHQLGTPATPGYGGVGPKTRALLNSLVK